MNVRITLDITVADDADIDNIGQRLFDLVMDVASADINDDFDDITSVNGWLAVADG